MNIKNMKTFLVVTVFLFVIVVLMATYLFVDGQSLFTSVLNTDEKLSQLPEEDTDNSSIEKSYNYEKVEVLEYSVEGGSIVFKVEDQNVGYIDRYIARCENKDDSADVREAKYNIPSIAVYGLMEQAVYRCFVAIERDGQMYAKSRVMNIKTGESSYDKVEVAKTDSSFDSVTLEAKNQFIDYQDLYAAKCFARGSKEIVEAGDGAGLYKGEDRDTVIVIAGLDQNKEYECYLSIKKADGIYVNESDPVFVKTKIGMTNIVASDTMVTLEIDNQKISSDDFYFAKCTRSDDETVVQKAFSSEPKIVVEGLSPQTEYTCFVGVEGVEGTKTRTNNVVVKTLENPYGQVEILSTVLAPDMIEFEVKDLELSYRDFYVARCENTQNKDLVYIANSKYPKIRVRDLLPSQEYQCVLSVEMPTRTVGKSAPILLKTPELEFPFGQ